jgi:hypothetical protein
MPARVDYNSGILIEPHILERPKFKSKTKVTYTQPQYDVTLKQHEKPLSADYNEYTATLEEPVKIPNTEYLKQYESVVLQPVKIPIVTYNDYNFTLVPLDTDTVVSTKENLQSIGNPQIKDMYAPSIYKYSILVPTSSTADAGYGAGWAPQTNGYWNYNVTSSTAINSKPSKYAQSKVLFYSTRESASLGLPSSSSLVPASVSADEKSFAMENLTFVGCKMTSDSLTTNSPDTPDGKPVIEIFAADANVLIYTSTTAAGGNLEVGALTNQPSTFIDLQELYVWEFIKHQLLKEYNAEKKAFRQKIGKLVSIESTRRDEFTSRIETDVIRREYEDLRRIEFDVVNKGLDTFDENDEAANKALKAENDRLEQEERDNLFNSDDGSLPIFVGNQQTSRFKESLEFLKIKFKDDDEKNAYFQATAITTDRQTELLLLDYAFKVAPEGPIKFINNSTTDSLLISEANSIVAVYDKAK